MSISNLDRDTFTISRESSTSSSPYTWECPNTQKNGDSNGQITLSKNVKNLTGADTVSKRINVSPAGVLTAIQSEKENPSVFDVASYILQKIGSMSTWKLQKLVYYCQAWSLVWDGEPLYAEDIKAWKNGPVVPALYAKHKGKFKVTIGDIPGNPSSLQDNQRDTINTVLAYYGDKSPQWLSDLTHMEDPWKEARQERDTSDSPLISLDSIAAYYESLENEEK